MGRKREMCERKGEEGERGGMEGGKGTPCVSLNFP